VGALRLVQWRDEGEPVEPGLSFWRPGDRSIGFVLSLNRWHMYCRYSRVKKKLFWEFKRLEPRAWRMLKEKNERND
jgi:hypothetical protein